MELRYGVIDNTHPFGGCIFRLSRNTATKSNFYLVFTKIISNFVLQKNRIIDDLIIIYYSMSCYD